MDDTLKTTINDDDLVKHIVLIKKWIDQYDQFLSQYTGTGDGKHIMLNNVGLTTNSFHYETGRGGYFSTNSGTSEGQTLTLRGALLAYKATGKQIWLDRALKLSDALLSILYQDKPIPDEPDVTWVPHWLFNAKQNFKSQQYFTNMSVAFTNGKATIKKDDIFKVFSVRAADATLVWDSPFSQVNGKSYSIKSLDYPDNNTAIVTLDENVTGNFLVVYGTNTGDVIHTNDNYDAYPVWRKLEQKETVCAIDSLAWSYDCFKLLFEATGEEKWNKALKSTAESIKHAFHIDNAIVYIAPPRMGYDIFENGMYKYSSRDVLEIYSQNKVTGFIDIHYPQANYGEGQIGKGSVNASFGKNDYLLVKMSSKQKLIMKVALDEESVYQEDKRWVVPLHLDGSGKMQTFNLPAASFFRSSDVFWGVNYRGNADGSKISDGKSTISSETVIDKNIAVQEIVMNKVSGGWAQFLFGMGSTPAFPFDFKYKTNDDLDFVVRDSKDKPWRYRLPKTNGGYKAVTMTADLFTSDSGDAAFPSGSFSSLLVDCAASKSEIVIDYLGKLTTLPIGSNYATLTLSYAGTEEADVSIELVAPMPTTPLTYVPYVAPFDYHLSDGNINSWRGPAYSGYQTPYIWQELPEFTDEFGKNNQDALGVNLKFMRDAQAAYKAKNGIQGGFTPVYFWNRWDSIQYEHQPDTWGWLPAPDPNVNWGGFQYRAVDSVARAYFNDSSNELAKDIVMDFFRMIDTYWTTDFNMPTVFDEGVAPKNTYDDTHMACLLIRALVNTYISNQDRNDRTLLIKLINKSLNYMNKFHIDVDSIPFSKSMVEGTFSTESANGQWYGFWGGEILSALAEIVINTRTHVELW
ncbi:hypothetical protein [Leuconostoc citreum]